MTSTKIATGAIVFAILSGNSALAADRATSHLPSAPIASNQPVRDTGGFDWNGFYAGVSASYGWGEFDDRGVDGLTLGGQVGYNMNLDGIVVGIEADYQDSGIQWRDRAGTLDTRAGIDHFGTVRGRLGVDLGNIMPYVTGGLAFGSLATRADDGRARDREATYGLGCGCRCRNADCDRSDAQGRVYVCRFSRIRYRRLERRCQRSHRPRRPQLAFLASRAEATTSRPNF